MSLRKNINVLGWIVEVNHDELTVGSVEVGLKVEFGADIMDGREFSNPVSDERGHLR